jgi:hypothetical protein
MAGQGQQLVQEEQGQVVGDQVVLVQLREEQGQAVLGQVVLVPMAEQGLVEQVQQLVEQGRVVGDQVALVLTVVLVQQLVERGQVVGDQVVLDRLQEEQVPQLVEQDRAVGDQVVQGQQLVQVEQGQVVGDQVALVLTVALVQLQVEQGRLVGDQVAPVLMPSVSVAAAGCHSLHPVAAAASNQATAVVEARPALAAAVETAAQVVLEWHPVRQLDPVVAVAVHQGVLHRQEEVALLTMVVVGVQQGVASCRRVGEALHLIEGVGDHLGVHVAAALHVGVLADPRAVLAPSYLWVSAIHHPGLANQGVAICCSGRAWAADVHCAGDTDAGDVMTMPRTRASTIMVMSTSTNIDTGIDIRIHRHSHTSTYTSPLSTHVHTHRDAHPGRSAALGFAYPLSCDDSILLFFSSCFAASALSFRYCSRSSSVRLATCCCSASRFAASAASASLRFASKNSFSAAADRARARSTLRRRNASPDSSGLAPRRAASHRAPQAAARHTHERVRTC